MSASEAFSPAILFFLWLGLWAQARSATNETPRPLLELLSFVTVLFGLHLRYLTILMPLQVYAVPFFLARRQFAQRFSLAILGAGITLAIGFSHVRFVRFALGGTDHGQDAGALVRLKQSVETLLFYHVEFLGEAFLALFFLGVVAALFLARPLGAQLPRRGAWLLGYLVVADVPLAMRIPTYADQFRYISRFLPMFSLLAAFGVATLVGVLWRGRQPVAGGLALLAMVEFVRRRHESFLQTPEPLDLPLLVLAPLAILAGALIWGRLAKAPPWFPSGAAVAVWCALGTGLVPLWPQVCGITAFDEDYRFMRLATRQLPDRVSIFTARGLHGMTFPGGYHPLPYGAAVPSAYDLRMAANRRAPMVLWVPLWSWVGATPVIDGVYTTDSGQQLHLRPLLTREIRHRPGVLRGSSSDSDSPFSATRHKVTVGYFEITKGAAGASGS